MKNDYTKLNIPYCRKVLEFAETKHPDITHKQEYFYQTNTECGTTACIAGIACLQSPDTRLNKYNNLIYKGRSAGWSATAAELMGLNKRQRWDLFYRNTLNQNPEKSAVNLLRKYIQRAEQVQYG